MVMVGAPQPPQAPGKPPPNPKAQGFHGLKPPPKQPLKQPEPPPNPPPKPPPKLPLCAQGKVLTYDPLKRGH